MIRNERQYRITKAQAEKFRAAIAVQEKAPPAKGIHPRLHQASLDGLRAQLATLERELKAFDALQRGTKTLRGRASRISAGS